MKKAIYRTLATHISMLNTSAYDKVWIHISTRI